MIEYFAEFLGTLVLILLGNGVVANVLLNRTGGHNGGWIVITFGWGIGVFVGVILSTKYSGAHLNPAVTIGLALAGLFEPVKVVPFIVAQFCGAITGSWMVYLFYRDHFRITSEPGVKKACFCTAPGIRKWSR